MKVLEDKEDNVLTSVSAHNAADNVAFLHDLKMVSSQLMLLSLLPATGVTL